MSLVSRVVLVLVLAVASARLSSQQAVGISLANVISPSLSVLCGFDCNNAGNTGRVLGSTGQTFDVRLFGDASLPAAVAIGLGPVWMPCPGLVVPGVHNGLMIDPASLLATLTTATLNPGSRTCTASGSLNAVSLNIPAAASGLVLTFQGLVFDNGTPAFTRPIDMTVR